MPVSIERSYRISWTYDAHRPTLVMIQLLLLPPKHPQHSLHTKRRCGGGGRGPTAYTVCCCTSRTMCGWTATSMVLLLLLLLLLPTGDLANDVTTLQSPGLIWSPLLNYLQLL